MKLDPDEPLENGNPKWHVNRGVPVVFIASLFVMVVTQVALAAWFISSMVARIDVIERAQLQMQLQMPPLGERLTRVEEKMVSLQTIAADIKAILQSRPR